MIWLILFVFFVVMQGIFSGLETGMVSVMRPRVTYAAKFMPGKAPHWILFFLDHPNIMISTTLIDINISVVLAAISLKKFLVCIGLSGALGITIATVVGSLLLLVTELIPKNYFRQSPFSRCLHTVFLLYYSYLLLKPVVLFFAYITDALNRSIAAKCEGSSPTAAKQEQRENFRLAVKESESCGAIDEISAGALDRAVSLSAVKLGTLCHPIQPGQFVDAESSVRDAFQLIRSSSADTLPVCKQGKDSLHPHCIGAFNAYEVLADLPESVWADERVIDHMSKICILHSSDDVTKAVCEARKSRIALFIITDDCNRQMGFLDPEEIAALLFW